MTHAGSEVAEGTKEQTALAGLLAALRLEHPKERSADPIQWAPVVIIYPEEAERVVEKALTGKWHTLLEELEFMGQEIANMRDRWSRNVSFKRLSYEEARKRDQRVDIWMLLPENVALSAHGFIFEDGPELPKEEGKEAAEEYEEVLTGMYAQGCESLDQARIPASPGMPRTGVGTEPVGECTGEWGGGIGIQSAQERIPTPVPSDQNEAEMTSDHRRLIRTFRKGGRPSTALGVGVTNQCIFPLTRIQLESFKAEPRMSRDCRELRIREGGLVCMPRVSVGLGVASHPSGA
jgi:hypothetical protein